jgi:interferon gamma-inducible protein 30
MISHKLIILTLSFLILVSSRRVPLKIDIYIESLCPDSRNFVLKSFRNFQAFPNRAQLADVTFYSFGNAIEKLDGSKWVFECQHGENECLGNTIHSCAQARLEKDAYNNFLICIFNDIGKTRLDFKRSLSNCLNNTELVGQILQCANSKEGNELHHRMARLTPAEHTYVPWVTVDGKHNKNVEDMIMLDMVKYLCKDRQEVPGCKTRFSSGL